MILIQWILLLHYCTNFIDSRKYGIWKVSDAKNFTIALLISTHLLIHTLTCMHENDWIFNTLPCHMRIDGLQVKYYCLALRQKAKIKSRGCYTVFSLSWKYNGCQNKWRQTLTMTLEPVIFLLLLSRWNSF